MNQQIPKGEHPIHPQDDSNGRCPTDAGSTSLEHVPSTDAIPMVSWHYLNTGTGSGQVSAWHLLVGAVVEIRRDGHSLGTGIVDDATSSGDIVWIAADGINSRTMIEKNEGYDIRIATISASPGFPVHGN